MRFRERLRFALRGLRRQPVRTLLTALGVAVGACTLAFSIALGVGLRDLIDREFHSRPGFWEIGVMPGKVPPPVPESEIPSRFLAVEGSFDAAQAGRIRRQLVQRYQNSHRQGDPAEISDAVLATIRSMPDVAEVIAPRFGQGYGYWQGKSAFVNVVAGRAGQRMLAERILAGRVPKPDAAECAVSEMLLYDLGARSEAEMRAALGTSIEIEFADRRKPGIARKAPAATFTIVGIAAGWSEDDEGLRGIYTHRWTTVHLGGPAGEVLFRQMPSYQDGHYDAAEVRVTPGGNLPAVVDAIEALGLQTTSAVKWFASTKREVTLIGAGLNVFAIVSLIVAALGITNTLVTSVVERIREIGILRAVGASSGQIRSIFLLEGMTLGLVGGILGLILARLLAGPADEFIRQQVQSMMRGQTLITTSVFDFHWWLNLAVPLFAAVITTLAALYPAHRAARIAPVEALRYG